MRFCTLIFSILLLPFFASRSNAQISATGLIGQWDYNGNAGDSSGNARHGTGFNITYGAARSGRANNAALFDGSSSYVSVPYSAGLNIANYSICATVKLTGFYTGTCQVNTIFMRGVSHNNGNYSLIFADTIPDCGAITADTNVYTVDAEAGTFSSTVPGDSWHYPYYLHTGGWYTMIVTFNGLKNYVYINGQLVDSAASTLGPGTIGTSSDGAYMGANYMATTSSFPYWFKGYMDDVRVYSRILADSEIVQYHTNIVIGQPIVSCLGSSFTLPYNLKDSITFVTGDKFTAQISDASGSFASPVNIGSVTVGATHPLNGSIPCVIPTTVTPGSGYKIRVVTTNSQYFSSPVKNLATLAAAPVNVTAASNTPICSGDTLRLSASTTTTSGVTWTWTGPNGYSSTSQNNKIPAPTPVMSGNYIVTATLTATGCSVKDTETVQISTTPVKPVAGSNAPLCVGSALNFTASSATAGVVYSWAGPGGFTSTAQNPSRTSSTTAYSGDYILTVNLNGCVNKDTINVTVYPIPSKPAVHSNSPVCLGSSINLTANSTAAGASYSWTGPSSFTSSAQNPVIATSVAANAGTYIVTVSANGCTSAPDSVKVVTVPGPGIVIYPSPSDSVCFGTPVRLNALISNAGTGATFQWLKNNQPVPGATHTLYTDSTVTHNDAYSIMLIPGTGAACTTAIQSNAIPINVLPYKAPSVTMTGDDSTYNWPGVLITFTSFPVDAGALPKYQWKVNGKDVLGATGYTWGTTTLQDADNICVVVTSTYLCPEPMTDTACKRIKIATGISKLGNEVISIYPNPVSNQLTIEGVTTGTKMQLTDMHGKAVYESVCKTRTVNVNTSALATGTYMLVLTDEQGHRLAKKIVKE